MSAEAHYFAMYNTNCSAPVAAAAAPAAAPSVGPTPEACFFTMYNTNCSYVPNTAPSPPASSAPTPETQYFSRYNSEVRALEAQRVASVAETAQTAHRSASENRGCAAAVADPEACTVPVVSEGELRPRRGAESRDPGLSSDWPSEAFDEVPQGSMTIRSWLDQLKTNLLSAEEGKPPGYLKAFAQKVFNFTVTESNKKV